MLEPSRLRSPPVDILCESYTPRSSGWDVHIMSTHTVEITRVCFLLVGLGFQNDDFFGANVEQVGGRPVRQYDACIAHYRSLSMLTGP